MLESLVKLLPESWQPKAKSVLVALGTIAGLLTLVLDSPEWLTAVIAVLTALGVYQTPNIGYIRPQTGTTGYWGGVTRHTDTTKEN